MKHLKTRCIFLSVLLLVNILSSCQNKEQKLASLEPVPKIELENFFRNVEKRSFKISPDGEYFAYLAPWKNRMNLFVKKIDQDSAFRLTSVTDRDIAGLGWVNSQRLIYLRDNGGDENYYAMAVDKDGKNAIALTKFDNVVTQFIDELENQDDYILIGLNKRNPQIFDPYRLNVNTGELEMLAENPGNITGWKTDHQGKLRIATTTDGVNTSILYRATESEPFQELLTTTFKDSFKPLIFTFDNKNLYVSSNIGRDKNAIKLFNIESKTEQESIFEHNDVDVYNLSYSKKRKKLTAVHFETDKDHLHFLDAESETVYNKLKAQLPSDEQAIISSENKEEDKLIVRTYSDKSRGSYYFYDVKADKLQKLEDLSPWLDKNQMAEMKPIEYTTRDGLKINGYLTLPVGVKAENLPVIINPHGGPWARDSWGFNPEVQFFANRGYAVLQMNFRGSTGYGKSFWTKSFKQWGKTMQDDITDGTNWLVEQGIADKNRIAIYGGSYGGYATLQGLVREPDLYACGVDYVGVSNLFTFMGTIPPYWKPYLEMLYEMVGDLKADSVQLKNTSPALNAEKIKSPLFIAQGANDPRVNKSESDQMVKAMKARGVEVEYLVKDNEGHGFRNEENKFEFYRSMEAFLDKHLKKENLTKVQ
ncbi:S9 family peptidase [Aureibacter tunicatorum]|uniref:Dipeptidyl aminopeptidase/acylaminoacyl peptidase n=1 Tax=Aureibacter tunicatorum TaxID=866807 RepID=A0AAE4BTK9_9BACT|nr:S9 family peptidase [Aureibacter tunicatorum]MDR6240791.1 dipeptidyl aminopeptidase/acylaminoacyl peptidase [Aureibacter tunicatorum]BDD06876.1 peptidase [Aureibacter tunicatorum]